MRATCLGLIPEDKIAEIRDRTDIVQVIGEYVSLKRTGVNHKGLCPFHNEKSPVVQRERAEAVLPLLRLRQVGRRHSAS